MDDLRVPPFLKTSTWLQESRWSEDACRILGAGWKMDVHPKKCGKTSPKQMETPQNIYITNCSRYPLANQHIAIEQCHV